MATNSNPNNISSSWDVVRKHSKQLGGFRLSPTKDIKFSKFQESTAPVALNLDGTELVFDNHLWHLASQSGEAVHAQLIALKDQNRGLQEENQLLKFKMEVLLDMLSTTKLDLLASEMELQKYRPLG